MKLRPLRGADLEAVVGLFTASVHGLAVTHYDARQGAAWAPQAPDLDAWRQRLDGLQTLVAEADGVLVGFVSFGRDGHIDLLYVAATHARQGVAARLYARAESTLLASGVMALYTEASLVARPFFERQGFVVDEAQAVTRNGVVLRRFLMRKSLSAGVQEGADT